MNPIQKILNLPLKEYYMKHLAIVSCLLPTHLTVKEIEVLSSFLVLSGELTKHNLFNPLCRKKVRETLNLSQGGLGNYLKSMTDKKVLMKSEEFGKLEIRPFLMPDAFKQGYQIMLINESAKPSQS